LLHKLHKAKGEAANKGLYRTRNPFIIDTEDEGEQSCTGIS
jgi:hypothetical protein